jgi:6-phosphogluconolactonase
MTQPPKVLVAPSKADVASFLCPLVATLALQAMKDHGAVSIALSGGSLPSFLAALPEAFKGADPQWSKWYVFLADERCVPEEDDDSNMKALKDFFLSKVGIPEAQVYGINQDLLQDTAAAMASDYQSRLVSSLKDHTNGKLDIAVLGFGPDGHTCSLFPNHKLVGGDQPSETWVAAIEDSPKPPPKRITLTLPALNENTENVILCGAGGSKQPIIAKVFKSIKKLSGEGEYEATMAIPPPYPCAMVAPKSSLTWVLDQDALGDESNLGREL